MNRENGHRDAARKHARAVLAKCKDFPSLPAKEQLELYKSLVTAKSQELAIADALGEGNGVARQMAPFGLPTPGGNQPLARRASDMINDRRHENRRIEQAGDLAGDFIDNVDFPGFVRDLLKGVFDANLEVTLKQMDAYINLMKAATQSIAKFVNAIDDSAAFGYLVENNNDEFSLDFDDDEKDDSGQPQQVLKDKDGNVVAKPGDLGDNEIKARIMDAKIAMAKEQRALLRETILMGVSRLVVEKGTVKAAVVFDIKAKEQINKKDKAASKGSESETSSANMGTGLISKLFGGGDTGTTHAKRRTEISLSSASSKASTDLQAKVTGSVEIIFKSDYFKLDNFATMYQIRDPAPAAPGAPGGAPALPPGGTPK
jgi:hypothetical protein